MSKRRGTRQRKVSKALPSVPAPALVPDAERAPDQTMNTLDDSLDASTRTSSAIHSFATVIHRVDHLHVEELNRDLAALILEQESTGENFDTSVAMTKGFHSSYDFLQLDAAPVVALRKLISEDINEYLLAYWTQNSTQAFTEIAKAPGVKLQMWGWSMVLRAGGMVAPHIHPSCHLSGVYYVSLPNSEEEDGAGGSLTLGDPRTRAGSNPLPGQRTVLNIQPAPGVSVLFPSYVEHYVLPFSGDGERVAISFNVRIEGISQ